MLIEAGENLETLNTNKEKPIHLACQKGDTVNSIKIY